MVNLTLTPHRGNGARTFPSTGYLGLSPVTLAGVVRVKIQEDNKPIEASSLVVRVRCYETVGGGTSPATASTNQQGSSGASMSSSSAIPTTTNPIASTSSSFSSSSSASPTNFPFSGSHSGTSVPSTSASASANASVGASGNQHSLHSSSSASSPSKGKVLYEKNLTLWLPPAPTNASTSTASTASSSPSPATSACSSSSCSRSNSVERGCSTGPQSHLYPPSQPPRRENCLARYGTLGEYQKAFRIVIPPEAVNEGAKSTMIFKNWRVWWAIEAVIAHKNLGVLGDRIVRSHQVSLISYAPVPTPSIPLSWLSPPSTSESEASIPTSSASRTTSTTHPALSYSITSSTSAYGSSDPVSFSVKLTKRSHMSETPRKVVLELRREILFTAADSPLASSHHSFESQQQHSSSAVSSTPSSASASAAVAAVAAATATGSNKRSSYFGNRHSRGVSQPISLGSSGGSNQHHSSAAGGGGHLISSLGSPANKHKTESTEALVSPPLLSTASTISTNSAMPATPPLNVPTPVEYQEAQTESYFGLFKNGDSTASPKTSSQPHGHGHAHGHFALPRQIHFAPNPTSAAPIALSLPSAQIYLSKRKREDVSLATFEADCLFTSSTWSGTITGNMPKAKSLYHYALGETCNTASACSRFYIVARIQYKSKQTFLELPPQNLVFFTVSEEERRKAIDLLPKTLATQKAEAKLFDGVEVREKRSSAGATHPSRTTHSQPFLQVAPNATTSAGPSSTSSSRSRSHQKPLEARRDRISKSVSPKVSGSMSASSSPSEEEELLDNDTEARAKRANGDQHRSSNVRRRSEQSDAYEVSRTRKRFGSTPDLSPVVGSPYIDAVSPSLSLISSSTTRPRTAGSRRPNTGNSSIRSGVFTGWSTRPRSAAGLEPSSSSVGSIPSGRFAHIATFEDLCRLSNPASATTTTTTTASRRPSNPSVVGDEESSDAPSAAHSAPVAMLESRSSRSSSLASSSNSSPEAHVRYEAKENLTPLAAEYTTISSTTVNGLFADFNGFSLKSGAPVGRSTVPVIKEELVPPKPGAHVANSKIQAVSRHPENVAANGVISSKRKSVDLLADTRFPPGKMGSESRTSSNTSASAESTFSSGSSHDRSSNSNSNSNSNSGVSMREITLAMPPASVGMNPNASSNGTLLVPPVSMRGTGPNGSGRSSPMSKASSHTSMLESAAAAAASASAGKGEDARRRSRSGGMASAFSFFRRSSTKT